MFRPGAALTSALVVLVLTACGCKKEEPIKSPFKDDFERPEVGANYFNTGGPYEMLGGKLKVKGAFNHPLWLKKVLPRDAVIEFDVVSKSAAGDIKVEAWGDGASYASSKGAYLATSYVFVFGGWGNSKSILARMDEHAPDVKARTDVKVQPGRSYHWKIQRKGKRVEWHIDGQPFLALDDPSPLEGKGHSHFGFNNWQTELYFDNLVIKPL